MKIPEYLQSILKNGGGRVETLNTNILNCVITYHTLPAILVVQVVRTPAELHTAQPGSVGDNVGLMTIMASDHEARHTTNIVH